MPPDPPGTPLVDGLPAALTSFVGREREVAELVELLGARRLVTLTGVGGAGKTRLALEVVARVGGRHRDGVRLVELAGLFDGALVPDAVLAALDMREPGAGRTPTEALCGALAHRDLLLVVDNCEHVIDAVAALAGTLLAACGTLRVLATSREAMRIPGEVERSVAPLDRPQADAPASPERLAGYEAVRLLVERASDVQRDFRIGPDNAAAIERISAALDGIPLAIEIVAARLRTLSVDAIAAQLGDQMALIQWDGRGRPDRQRTMRATLDWSHKLLSEDERAVFRRLSIFANGFTLDAAEVVAGGEPLVGPFVDVIGGLIAKCLIESDPARVEPRMRMLEPVRQYAADRLIDAAEREVVADRYLAWGVRFAEHAGRGFLADSKRWAPRVRDEQDNVRRALELALAHAGSDVALRIAGSLGWPWFTMGQPDARRWMGRALEASHGAPPSVEGLARFGAGLLAESASDYEGALLHLQRALQLARGIRARRLEGWVLMALGRAAWAIDVAGKAAAQWLEEALHIFREVDDPASIGRALVLLSDDSRRTGDPERAAVFAAEALDFGRRAGSPLIVAGAQRELALVANGRGDHAEAERLLKHAVRLQEDAGDRWQLTNVLLSLAGVYADRGDFERAFAVARDSLRIARDVGSLNRLLYGLVGCATVIWRAGAAVEAAALVDAAERATGTLPQFRDWLRRQPVVASLRRPAEDGDRGREVPLSLDAATEFALRILEDRLAALQGTHGGSEDAVDSRLAHDTFRRDGDLWTIGFAGKEIRLHDLRGLHYLATLLREPGREFHSTDLVRGGRGPASAPSIGDDVDVSLGLGDAGERLDARARSAYRVRLAELEGELADAERRNDIGRAEHTRAEREALVAELAGAARGKRAFSDAERARVAATKAIKVALDKIAASHPELGAHLHATVRRGYFCSYVPDPRHPIEWET